MLAAGDSILIPLSRIYAIEEHDVYWLHLQPIWTAFTAGEVQIVTSEITLLET
ncbi:MAG: hypothetical protein IPO41_04005 [Acidobacteria bacterium]|nr:hypothetical protein [Acidobacteriota bacterium]